MNNFGIREQAKEKFCEMFCELREEMKNNRV